MKPVVVAFGSKKGYYQTGPDFKTLMAANLADFPKEAEVCQELGPNPGGKVFPEKDSQSFDKT